MAGNRMTFPRTMQRGIFKGRTFETLAEYQRAINAHKKKFGPTRTINGKGKKKMTPSNNGHGEERIRKVVDSYELLREQGIGKAAAIKLLDTLMN